MPQSVEVPVLVTTYISYDHILDGGINTLKNGKRVGTGGHYLRSPNVRITEITDAADVKGVTEGKISIRDPEMGGWVPKPGKTSFYPEIWSKRQVMQEIEGAFRNSHPIESDMRKRRGISPSGIKIEGYYGTPDGTGATAWPVYGAKK